MNCKLTQVEILALKDKQSKKERFLTFFKYMLGISLATLYFILMVVPIVWFLGI